MFRVDEVVINAKHWKTHSRAYTSANLTICGSLLIFNDIH